MADDEKVSSANRGPEAYGIDIGNLGTTQKRVWQEQESFLVVKAVREILELPSNVILLNVIAVGYPDEDPPVKDKLRENSVHCQRW